ncbi:MAG: leader peptide processing enzyme [Sphaerochaetaceae bacterium]|nr:leader peptide processing enzyme [Sphaerochaetaceae bacterium]
MNKKVNTILFILGATILNLILMLVIFFVLFALLVRFVSQDSSAFPMLLALLFILSIGGSFFLYTFAMKKLSARIRLEDYLSPLFGRKPGSGSGRGERR